MTEATAGQGINPTQTLYPFAECIRAVTVGTTDVDLWEIPAKTLITDVFVVVVTAGVGNTTAYAAVGDEDDEDGFIAGFDPTSAAATCIGDDPTERGDYLYDSTKKALCGKYYATTKSMEVVLENATNVTTNPIFDVFVMGYRYA